MIKQRLTEVILTELMASSKPRAVRVQNFPERVVQAILEIKGFFLHQPRTCHSYVHAWTGSCVYFVKHLQPQMLGKIVILGIPDYEQFILCVAMLTNFQAGYDQHCAFCSNLIQTRNGSCSRMLTLKYACVHGSNERTCTMDVFRPRIAMAGIMMVIFFRQTIKMSSCLSSLFIRLLFSAR